jgi:hypothetical protein
MISDDEGMMNPHRRNPIRQLLPAAHRPSPEARPLGF